MIWTLRGNMSPTGKCQADLQVMSMHFQLDKLCSWWNPVYCSSLQDKPVEEHQSAGNVVQLDTAYTATDQQ